MDDWIREYITREEVLMQWNEEYEKSIIGWDAEYERNDIRR